MQMRSCGGKIIPLPADQYLVTLKPHLLYYKMEIKYFYKASLGGLFTMLQS